MESDMQPKVAKMKTRVGGSNPTSPFKFEPERKRGLQNEHRNRKPFGRA